MWPDKETACRMVCWGQKGDELEKVSGEQNINVPVCYDYDLGFEPIGKKDIGRLQDDAVIKFAFWMILAAPWG